MIPPGSSWLFLVPPDSSWGELGSPLKGIIRSVRIRFLLYKISPGEPGGPKKPKRAQESQKWLILSVFSLAPCRRNLIRTDHINLHTDWHKKQTNPPLIESRSHFFFFGGQGHPGRARGVSDSKVVMPQVSNTRSLEPNRIMKQGTHQVPANEV